MKRISTLLQENSTNEDFDFDLLEIEEVDEKENMDYEINSSINKREITTINISLTSILDNDKIIFNWNELDIDDFFSYNIYDNKTLLKRITNINQLTFTLNELIYSKIHQIYHQLLFLTFFL